MSDMMPPPLPGAEPPAPPPPLPSAPPDGATPPPISGPAIFFDGHTSARQEVTVRLGALLEVVAPDGSVRTQWPYDQIEELDAPDKVMRIGRHRNPVLERIEIFDASFAEAVDALAVHVDRTGAIQRSQHKHAVVLAVAAAAVLLLFAIFALPAIADRMAPLVPTALDRRIGALVEFKTRAELARSLGEDFECRTGRFQRPGRAALMKMMDRLEAAAGLPLPLNITVVRENKKNAFALPGERIYVFKGLIDLAEGPDELAGAIAHEIGHIAHRDGTRSILEAGGLSLMFGMLLGDFVGGGAVVTAAQTVLQNTYSRGVEAAADDYGAKLMIKAGGDPHALGVMLSKLGGATEPGMTILLDHPETKARVAAVERVAGDHRPKQPLIDEDDWAALKEICKR
ncbi:MAG TPA: M48 family metallopeptidase [Pseudolabrys sp.]|nr:M48 family metallopeptidase [Pseudolabrys sp.]